MDNYDLRVIIGNRIAEASPDDYSIKNTDVRLLINEIDRLRTELAEFRRQTSGRVSHTIDRSFPLSWAILHRCQTF